MRIKYLQESIRTFILILSLILIVPEVVSANHVFTIALSEKVDLQVELSSSKEELCDEKKAKEYISKAIAGIRHKTMIGDLSGIVTWKFRLMGGNWSWSNGVQGVWGESEIYVQETKGRHSFGFDEGHVGIGSSQWAAAKGTIDTHIMYLFLMVYNLDKLSPGLNVLFNSLGDVDTDLYSKVRNQLIIAASHTQKDVLIWYQKTATHNLLKAIAACGLAMQKDKRAERYLDKDLFEYLSMSNYHEAAIESLKAGVIEK